MRSPKYVDADLFRMTYGGTGALLETELDCSPVDFNECRCFAKDPGARGCSVPYTFADDAIRLSCSNGDRVADYLNNEGFAGDDLDRELLARLDRASERERVAIAKADREATSELVAIADSCERIAAELRATVALKEAGWPMQAIAKAGRDRREVARG